MWNWFLTALKSDIYDLQGGTTRVGIRCWTDGGTLILYSKVLRINLSKSPY